ncbi:MAG TPA: hypothetical protein VM286_04365 [Candidatus Thermoplasmatota archaeon]|nr:hypothetical protein [Candidatus Thermoplasmatota archaeon]
MPELGTHTYRNHPYGGASGFACLALLNQLELRSILPGREPVEDKLTIANDVKAMSRPASFAVRPSVTPVRRIVRATPGKCTTCSAGCPDSESTCWTCQLRASQAWTTRDPRAAQTVEGEEDEDPRFGGFVPASPGNDPDESHPLPLNKDGTVPAKQANLRRATTLRLRALKSPAPKARELRAQAFDLLAEYQRAVRATAYDRAQAYDRSVA